MQRAAAPREDRVALGVCLMALAVLCFTSIDTSAKWLILSGIPILQVVFMRYVGAFAVSLLLFLPGEGTDAFRSRAWGMQFLRSAFLVLSTILNFLALRHLPLSLTTTIFFMTPILVTLLAIPALGEQVGARRIAAVLIAFAGVLIVLQPWGAEWHPAMLLSLSSVSCISFYFILTRRLAGIDSNGTSQLWASGLGALCLVPVAIPIWQVPDGASEMAVLLGIGVFGAAGHTLATSAHRFAQASQLTPVVYLQLLFAGLASGLVFAQWPGASTLVGGAVIIGSGLYIYRREVRLKSRTGKNASSVSSQ